MAPKRMRLAALAALAASSLPLVVQVPTAGGRPSADTTRAAVDYVYRATVTASAVATDTYQTSTGKLTMRFRVVLRAIPNPKRGKYPAYSLILLRSVKLLGYSGSISAKTVAGCSMGRPLRRGARGNGFVVGRPNDGSRVYLLQLSFGLTFDHLPQPPPTDCFPSAEASWFQRLALSERSVSIEATEAVTDVRFDKGYNWLKRPSVLGEPPYGRLVAGKGFVVELQKRYQVGRDRRTGRLRIEFTRA